MNEQRQRKVPVTIFFQGILKESASESSLREIFTGKGEVESLFSLKKKQGWQLQASMIRTVVVESKRRRELVNVWRIESATQYVASSETIKNYKQYTRAISMFETMREQMYVPTITKLERRSPPQRAPAPPAGFLDDLIITWMDPSEDPNGGPRVAHIDVEDYKKHPIEHPIMEMMTRRGVAWAELSEGGKKNFFANLAMLRQLTHVEHEPT